eukprot:991144-Pelagomonas_calceolata.AAC.2
MTETYKLLDIDPASVQGLEDYLKQKAAAAAAAAYHSTRYIFKSMYCVNQARNGCATGAQNNKHRVSRMENKEKCEAACWDAEKSFQMLCACMVCKEHQ